MQRPYACFSAARHPFFIKVPGQARDKEWESKQPEFFVLGRVRMRIDFISSTF